MKLELWYPAKPYEITQAFGINNSAYKQFGFSKHNGIDFKVDTDGIVRAMCDCVVTETADYPTGAGISVRLRTLIPVEAEGHTEYVGFMYMHAKERLCKLGDVLKAGDPVMVADNTGFSTGPHTHISAYFVDKNNNVKLQYGDPESGYCFDFSKYYNGKFADDIVTELLKKNISLLQRILAWFRSSTVIPR